MKTVQEWFNELPSPIREKALANVAPERMGSRQSSMATAIMHAFTWSTTPEASTYWSVLHQKYVDGYAIPESYFPTTEEVKEEEEEEVEIDNTIVQLYNGNYALLRNCVVLTKGDNDGEYCMKVNAVKLYENNWCVKFEDEVIEDNR